MAYRYAIRLIRERQHAGAHQDTPVEASATMTPRVANMAHLQMHSVVCKLYCCV